MQNTSSSPPSHLDSDGIKLLDLLTLLAKSWRLLLIVPIACGALALGATYLMTPVFTAKTTFLPPQQSGSTSGTIASLGALANLTGGAAIKTPGDQHVALLQSTNVADRIVDRFKLMERFKAKYRFEARRSLDQSVRISLGKRDGLISIEVDATEPVLAAEIANQYVAELRRLSAELALTESQQRRVFFETELKNTRTRLEEAQQALQRGGFNAGALKAEPKSAAEGYARLKAELTAVEIRLQALRRTLTDNSPEIQQQSTIAAALRTELAKLEAQGGDETSADYIGRYREYKYQEALFEMYSKQFELARLDESREAPLIQVVDAAATPEYKSRPKRASIALSTTFSVGLLVVVALLLHHFWQRFRDAPSNAEALQRFRQAWRRH